MPDDEKTEQTPPVPAVSYRADDFFETYANQATYESSAWDLKIIFGLLDQSSGTARTKQTFALTIPWAQAKLAIFSLQLQVAATELQNGKIPIRPDLRPIEAPPLTPEQEKDSLAKELHDIYIKLREEFLRNI